MRLGVIGTSWIADAFIEGALEAGFQLQGVCSRSRARGEEFLEKYGGGLVFTQVEEMAASPELDVIYIASPNSLHFPHALACVAGGKHVLVEKPCFPTLAQVEEVLDRAAAKDVTVLETLRGFYNPAMEVIRQTLPSVGPVRHVWFNYMRYSSKYDEYKAGKNPPVFLAEYAGGALADLGIYLAYTCLDLFGKPRELISRSVLLDSGADGVSTQLLVYDGFHCVLGTSKMNGSALPNAIQGELGTLLIDDLFLLTNVWFQDKTGKKHLFEADYSDMATQQKAIYRILHNNDRESIGRAHQFMRDSASLLEQSRRQGGVGF